MTDINYDRPKATVVNDTPIAVHWEGAEAPTAEANLAAGTTGECTLTLIADADESGGVDEQDLCKFSITPAIDQERGTITFVITATPVNGDATDAPTIAVGTVTHPQTMDAWQTAAGRPRQA
jgi:hypothetical protein